MPTYPPYDKIASRTSEWSLTEADARALARATWVLTEKVHGANMGWGFRDNSATLVFAQKSRSSTSASGELHYCNMITYHGRPNLHAEYWDLLVGMTP